MCFLLLLGGDGQPFPIEIASLVKLMSYKNSSPQFFPQNDTFWCISEVGFTVRTVLKHPCKLFYMEGPPPIVSNFCCFQKNIRNPLFLTSIFYHSPGLLFRKMS